MSEPLRVAVVGLGYWGPNLLRNLVELPEALAVPIFQTAWKLVDHVGPERRAALFAEALVVAGHFGRSELVPTLLASLGEAIRVARPADLVW